MGEDERNVAAAEGGVKRLNEGLVVRHDGPLTVDGAIPELRPSGGRVSRRSTLVRLAPKIEID
jgi:hypothetical protein